MRTRDENKQDLIREKGLEMIVKEGFDGFSMQKLAKAAAVSPATLYIYFKNREEIQSTTLRTTDRRKNRFHAKFSKFLQDWKIVSLTKKSGDRLSRFWSDVPHKSDCQSGRLS